MSTADDVTFCTEIRFTKFDHLVAILQGKPFISFPSVTLDFCLVTPKKRHVAQVVAC